jgi:hypothetical protein
MSTGGYGLRGTATGHRGFGVEGDQWRVPVRVKLETLCASIPSASRWSVGGGGRCCVEVCAVLSGQGEVSS